jgi:hypothetical protein
VAERMTAEQVAGLRLPEWGDLVLGREGKWLWKGSFDADSIQVAILRMACAVASGLLPPALLDWEWAHVDGKPVPTVEQWEAAVKLSALVRTHTVFRDWHDHCDIIDPPDLPTIAPCPYCGAPCETAGDYVRCSVPRCTYRSPSKSEPSERIAAHNDVARKLGTT